MSLKMYELKKNVEEAIVHWRSEAELPVNHIHSYVIYLDDSRYDETFKSLHTAIMEILVDSLGPIFLEASQKALDEIE